jgi:hypothetical protein
MTVELLKKICKTDANEMQELKDMAKSLLDSKDIEPSAYATVLANINKLEEKPKTTNLRRNNQHYTDDEVLTVQQSHLDVYDGKKSIDDHIRLMKKMFSEDSSQYRNGRHYNKRLFKTLDEGEPSLGHSMPANWADALLELVQNRQDNFYNTLNACKAIYESTGNGNMFQVIQKWNLKKGVR